MNSAPTGSHQGVDRVNPEIVSRRLPLIASFFRRMGRRPSPSNAGGAPTPFVIFGRARTGTSLVASQLQSHHQIRCYGEAFHPKGVYVWIGRRGPERLRSRRERNPKRFADRLLSARRRERIVGFKMLNDQALSVQDEILSRSEIKKIVVYRANLLSVFASTKIARATGQWNLRNGEPVKQATVNFEPEEFAEFVSVNTAFYERVEGSIRASRSPHIRAEYASLAKPRSHAAILEFLGADPTVELSTALIKQDTRLLEERFVNWDRVVATLSGTEMEPWLREY